MRNRGKFVIVAIVALGVAAALFSVWYKYQTARRANDFWGPNTAALIVQAPEVKALQLEAVETPSFGDEEGMEAEPPPGDSVAFDDAYWKVLASHEARQARGIGNIRTAIVQDLSYEWRGQPEDPPNWQYALEFNNGKLWATVLFDFDSNQAALAGDRKTVRLNPAAGSDWRQFFDEQFAAVEPSAGQEANQADAPAAEKPDDSAEPASGDSQADPDQTGSNRPN